MNKTEADEGRWQEISGRDRHSAPGTAALGSFAARR